MRSGSIAAQERSFQHNLFDVISNNQLEQKYKMENKKSIKIKCYSNKFLFKFNFKIKSKLKIKFNLG